MKFSRIASVPALVFVLAACASTPTTAKYEALLETLKGRSEKDLIDVWGPPDSTYELGAEKYLTYEQTGSVYVSASDPAFSEGLAGGRSHTRGISSMRGYYMDTSCKTTFILTGGAIKEWRHEGNSCKTSRDVAAESAPAEVPS